MNTLPDVDTMFEQLLQGFPPEVEWQAREFKAFHRAPKLRTPHPLLRVVLLYGGLDESLRGMAGNVTLIYGRATARL
jgi:hypothetical protein